MLTLVQGVVVGGGGCQGCLRTKALTATHALALSFTQIENTEAKRQALNLIKLHHFPVLLTQTEQHSGEASRVSATKQEMTLAVCFTRTENTRRRDGRFHLPSDNDQPTMGYHKASCSHAVGSLQPMQGGWSCSNASLCTATPGWQLPDPPDHHLSDLVNS